MQIHAIVVDPELHVFGLPQFATAGSAGIDLRAMLPQEMASLTLNPNEQAMVSTGLRVWVEDPKYAALALPRSGLGSNKGLVLGNLVGLIDSDYQGPLMLCLWNRGAHPVVIQRGDRVAQLVVVPVMQYTINWVTDFSDSTHRASGGFGSSGVQ